MDGQRLFQVKVKPWLKKYSAVIDAVSNVVVIVGLIIVVVAFYHRTAVAKTMIPENRSDFSVLKERQFAIEKARKKGEKEYSFTTSFIPGIGYISNPRQYLEDWQKKSAIQ